MTDEQKKKKILKPYTVRVRVQGMWWEKWEVGDEKLKVGSGQLEVEKWKMGSGEDRKSTRLNSSH